MGLKNIFKIRIGGGISLRQAETCSAVRLGKLLFIGFFVLGGCVLGGEACMPLGSVGCFGGNLMRGLKIKLNIVFVYRSRGPKD